MFRLTKFVVLLALATVVISETMEIGETSLKKFYMNSEKLDQESAEEACKDMGGTLAALRTKEDMDFFEGLKGQEEEEIFWLGGRKRSGSSMFRWMDRTPVVSKPWRASGGTLATMAQCQGIVMDSETKQWGNSDCMTLAASICEVPLGVEGAMNRSAALVDMLGDGVNATQGLGSCEGIAKRTEDIQENLAKVSERIEKSIAETMSVQERLTKFEENYSKVMSDMREQVANLPKTFGDRAKDAVGSLRGLGK